ncbi:MAG: hypothetical protein V1811_00080 [Candidatus Micrarchaeota archaeon]
MNRIVVLFVLILFLGALVVVKPDVLDFVGVILSPQSDLYNQAVQFQAQHNADFVRYSHPDDKNFSIYHPIGYMIFEEESENATVKFVALSPLGDAEVITVRVADDVLSEDQVRSALEEIRQNANGEVFKSQSIESGKPVFIVNVLLEENSSGKNLFVRHATYINCQDSLGRSYSATVTSSITEDLSEDLPMINFMIHSFNC